MQGWGTWGRITGTALFVRLADLALAALGRSPTVPRPTGHVLGLATSIFIQLLLWGSQSPPRRSLMETKGFMGKIPSKALKSTQLSQPGMQPQMFPEAAI